MNKPIRYILKTIVWMLGVLVFLWIVLWIYVELNEAKMIARMSEAIRAKTHGEVRIKHASVSLIRTFPILSLQLSDVLLRDSLYPIHKRDFLSASDIYLRIRLKDLIHGRSGLGRITISNGSLNVFNDSLGHSNEYILRQEKSKEAQPDSLVPVIVLNNMKFSYEDQKRKKLYKAFFRTLKCEIQLNNDFVVFNAGVNALVNNFAINSRRGSYLKEANVEGKIMLSYNKKDHDLLINHVLVKVERQPFYFDGYFRIDRRKSDFNLAISTENIAYSKAVALLSDSLQSRLKGFAFSKPVSVQVTINGQTISDHGPDVRIKMMLDMSSIASAAGLTSLQFTRGVSDVDLTIVSSALAKDTMNGDLNGTIRVKGAEIRYVPRDFTLNNCSGIVRFNSNDIEVDSMSAIAGSTRLFMSGKTKNLITLGTGDPGIMKMNWKLSSPFVHIRDFKPFLSAGKFSDQQSSLDKLFSAGDVYITMTSPKMDYNHFQATQMQAKLVLQQSGVQLQNVSFNHANGVMEMTGQVKNGVRTNPLRLHTKMKNMDVPLLFSAFDNFGQDAVTKNNLKGKLTATVDFQTSLTNQSEVSGKDSKGTVEFLLENGELNNFAPLIQISKTAFKKHDFSQIRFANLKNRLDISGTTFIVNPMEIRSTAFTLSVEGTYDFKKGTDMSIRFPLRNLTKSQANTDLSDDARSKKGLGLRLRAKTGDDGKLQVSWDPFKRALKHKKRTKEAIDNAK